MLFVKSVGEKCYLFTVASISYITVACISCNVSKNVIYVLLESSYVFFKLFMNECVVCVNLEMCEVVLSFKEKNVSEFET